MNKNYEIKVYSLGGAFKETLEGNKLKSNISFSSGINGTQGQCNISLNFGVDDTLGFTLSDIIKIYAYDDLFSSGKLIFTGQIQVLEKQYTVNEQSIIITAFGLGVLLNNLIFQSGGNKVFALNQDPAQTVRNIIDYFNNIYTGAWLNYDANSIVNYGSNININFNYTDCFDAMRNIQNATESFYWYIHCDGTVYYRGNTNVNNILHKGTAQRDIQNIQIRDSIENLANYGFINYTTGINTFSDSTSITAYGRIDNYQNKTDILNSASATIFITDYINKNKNISSQSEIVINHKFDNGGYYIEDIKPGDRLTVLNFNGIINKQIVKINYTPIEMIVSLEDYTSLNKVIF